jgi:hypothetical protein
MACFDAHMSSVSLRLFYVYWKLLQEANALVKIAAATALTTSSSSISAVTAAVVSLQ